MPANRHRRPRRVAALTRVLIGAVVAVPLAAGCQALDDASQVIKRADLVNDLAARLDQSGELTYSAEYQLPGGQNATITQAQQPPQAAYTYPGGKLIITAEATTECDTDRRQATCTISAPPATGTPPSVALFASASAHGLITPPVVIGLLTAAALDPNAVIEQSDTTITGRHATCVQVRQVADAPASNFAACITTEGVLGSFSGVVDGHEIDLAMSRYREIADDNAFALPSGATIIDQQNNQ